MQAWSDRAIRFGLLVVTISLVVVACGGTATFSSDDGSASAAAEQLIESEAFAQRLGVDQMTDASCVEPPTQEVGERFVCSAQLPDDVALFNSLIDGEDRIFVDPVNIVTGDLVQDFAADAVGLLNADNAFDFPADAIDCGTSSVVLDDRQSMPCVLTDPASGVQFEATLRVNLRTAAVSVAVGEPIDS